VAERRTGHGAPDRERVGRGILRRLGRGLHGRGRALRCAHEREQVGHGDVRRADANADSYTNTNTDTDADADAHSDAASPPRPPRAPPPTRTRRPARVLPVALLATWRASRVYTMVQTLLIKKAPAGA